MEHLIFKEKEVLDKASQAVVIYHKDCVDGFASAWAFHVLKEKDYGTESVVYEARAYDESANVLYGSYHKYYEKDLYILDFSFDRETVKELARMCNRVLILDHHKTAQEALENWEDKPKNVEIVFDMDRSGAGITWDYFYSSEKFFAYEDIERSTLINYVEDRDLWKFKLPVSKAISAYISVQPKIFEVYSAAAEKIKYDIFETAVIGEALLSQHQQICESIVKESREITIEDSDGNTHKGLACNCTGHFASEVGNILAKNSGTFGGTYFSTGTGDVKWSLRSTGDYDVSKIAKAYGGGGHKNASGFTLYGGNWISADINIWSLAPKK